MSGHWVYMVRCKDDSLYTGWTTDLDRRLAAHNSGQGAKYTRGRGPVTLVYQKAFETQGEALSEEARIKRLPRPAKEDLIREESQQFV